MKKQYEVQLSNIKFLHFYMAIIIVMYHVGGMSSSNTTGIDGVLLNWLICFWEFLANIAMGYFFFISSYLLFKDLDYSNYGEKVKRRVHSLLIPFVLWNVIVLVMKTIVGKNKLLDIIYLFDMRKYPPDGPLWYMYCIFLLALISPLFLRVLKKYPLVVITSSAIICNLILHNNSFDDGYIVNLLHFFPIWLLGGALAQKGVNNKELCIMILVSCISFKGELYNYVFYVVELLIILILISTHRKLSITERNIYRCSFLMYVIHGPIIEVFGKTVKELLFSLIGNSFITIIISKIIFLIICITICVVFYYVFKRNKRIVNIITCNRG